MKELQIGSKVVRIRATPLAATFYEQEFKNDLVGDFLKMIQSLVGGSVLKGNEKLNVANINLGALNVNLFMQLTWAMSKADAYGTGTEFPAFLTWVSQLEEFDLFSNDLIEQIIAEAQSGFFRGGGKFIAPTAKRK